MIDRDELLRGDGKSSEKELSEDYKLKYKKEIEPEEKKPDSSGMAIPQEITNSIIEMAEIDQRRRAFLEEQNRLEVERGRAARTESLYRERERQSRSQYYDAVRHSQTLQDQTFPERNDFRFITPSGATIIIPGREIRLYVNSRSDRAEVSFRLPVEVAHTIYREVSMDSLRTNTYFNQGTSGAKGI